MTARLAAVLLLLVGTAFAGNNVNNFVTTIPEPGMLALMAVGGVVFWRRLRRRR